MSTLNILPMRVPIGRATDPTSGKTIDVLMTTEFWRALSDIFNRVGGTSGLGSDDVALLSSFSTVPELAVDHAAEAAQSAPADLTAQVIAMRTEIDSLRSEVAMMQPLAALGQQLEEIRALIGMVEDPGAMVRYLTKVGAKLDSPAFTGTPTAPTAAVDTNTTQVATTAFVLGQASTANPTMNGPVAPGVSLRYARGDHVHPVDTSRQATIVKGTATGSRAGNAALASLLTALAASGLVTDSTTA